MRLPFFKKNNAISAPLVTQKKNLEMQITDRLQDELKATSGYVTLLYTFTTEHGRKGDKFAAKLAENGDRLSYFSNKDKKYLIVGKSEKLLPNEQEIKELLLAKVDMGVIYNCVLTEWSIVTEL